MKHYILVKFRADAPQGQELYEEISALFNEALNIEGIHDVSIYPASITSEKRYDLMILMDMNRDALEVFDGSQIHRLWKERFSAYLEGKVIFDCE